MLAWVFAGLSAFAMAGWHASLQLNEQLPARLEGQDVLVDGVVGAMPQVTETGVRFRFDVESAWVQPRASGSRIALQEMPSSLSLGWYREGGEEGAAPPALVAGQRWRFVVRLRRPHGLANPGGFDYELWLFEQGIGATGTVRSGSRSLPVRGAGTWRRPVERLRQHVRDAILARVSDARAAGVLAALAVGDQAAIERSDWDVFRNTGVAHLMSISGLHVTMFAWLAACGMAPLWRRSRRLTFWCATSSAAQWAGVAAAWAYALFSGWGVPAQRTVVMLLVACVLRSMAVRWPWPLVLGMAAVAVSALDPWALLQPGFWLSFMAVGLLMASGGAERKAGPPDEERPASWPWMRRALVQAVRTQAIATIGLAPLTLVFFQQLSLVGFLANMLAIPLVTLVITPLALLGSFMPVWWMLGSLVVQALSAMLAWLSHSPGAVWTLAASPWWAQMAALAGALLLLLPLPWRVRALSLPLVWPLLLPVRHVPPEGGFDMMAVDVGQGTSVLVRTRHKLLVYDTGPRYSADSDAGQRALVPLLRRLGESHIDLLMLSHRDTDHVGGAASLADALPVDAVLSSLEVGHPLLARASLMQARKQRCEAGQSWVWDGVRFDVLHPLPAGEGASALPAKPNAVSCVLKVTGLARSLLLTGDIEAEQERRLVRDSPNALPSMIMTAPHHGSATSSTREFIGTVHPRLAIVQSGYMNRFGHPAAEVLARYRTAGVAVESSPVCGAWTWRALDAAPVCEREAARRYWNWSP